MASFGDGFLIRKANWNDYVNKKTEVNWRKMMKCSLCRLINPDNTIRCACGSVFNSNQVPESGNNWHPVNNESIQWEPDEIVTNIPVPFGSIVLFTVKLFIAFIPVFILMALIFIILYAIFRGLIVNLLWIYSMPFLFFMSDDRLFNTEVVKVPKN